ncbi:MAG TPA: hypothetical protein VF222_12810 [Nitrososphaeraceae archaeon]
MAVNTSKNSDDYKKEIVKPISITNNNNNNNAIDQPTTSEKVNPDERDTKESEMQGKSESIKDKTSGKISEFVEGTKSEDKGKGSSNGIKSIIFGLFALIGFIIIVYSIFVGVVGEPLASVADTVFVAVIIGSFTLVGAIVGRIFLKK